MAPKKTLPLAAAMSVLLTLTGCAGLIQPTPTATVTETAQPEPAKTVETEPEEAALKQAVTDYTAAFFTDAEATWNLLSEECKAKLPLPGFQSMIDKAKVQYPSGAEIEAMTVAIDGDKASATYSLNVSELSQESQSWVKEGGEWKYNGCVESGSSEPQEKTRPAFGDTYTYPSGISVKVGEPEEITPSEYAITGEGIHLKFDITLTNDTGEDFDPILFTASAASGGEEAERIFDGEKIGGAPSTTILDGKKVTFSIGFSVLDPEDITMDVSPSFSFDERSVVFTN